ncbi:unnamed protein product [Phaedon cochleariae]|uniref:SMP-LTD domain-containing protein n=1 Tax=Phaedon cochleariae TaxID=80249 RepID=A0A9N9SN18_PHACE|nr:unnamed protein product [Phaedon cochleariae]
MSREKNQNKVTLGMLKGKSITTSVPSISIKFHANAEQIEELYASEEETNKSEDKSEKSPAAPSVPFTIGEPDSSPLKYLNRLSKRSTSVDVSSAHPSDASPPSDPWKFFSDIKGKITKSVEEKLTEIKARSQEEGSPHHKSKLDLKTIRDSKENSSVSDSEDLSESSISKTCGIISTTEGVEMSSDEDTSSLEKDKNNEKASSGVRHRFRFFKKHHQEEGTVKVNDLSKLYNINTESAEQALPEDSEGVESAVDALEETDQKSDTPTIKVASLEVLKSVCQKIDNLEIGDNNVVDIREVSGMELKEKFFDCNEDTVKTVFAPTGFVDLRPKKICPPTNYLPFLILGVSVVVYFIIYRYSPYSAGMAAGIILSYTIFVAYTKLHQKSEMNKVTELTNDVESSNYFEIQAVKEYQPLQKYEGWVNEYPDIYSPETYHIFQTQSVFLRLQGNLLRISHSKNKVSRRAMFNEPEIKASFTRHRIYNLIGAKISLLPEGLARKRFWSKKYPICITLSSEQMSFDPEILSNLDLEVQKHMEKDKAVSPSEKDKSCRGFKKFRKNKEYPVLAQRFSKLTEDEEFDLDSDSRASTPSVEISDVADFPTLEDENLLDSKDDVNGSANHSLLLSPSEDTGKNPLKIYLFGRTDREKEDWFRRLCTGTHKSATIVSTDSSNPDLRDAVSDTLSEAAQTELQYLKYMSIFKTSKHKQSRLPKDSDPDQHEKPEEGDSRNLDSLLWLNSLIGRILFDCVRDANFIGKVKDRIERKLSTIKLPYFIEEIHIPELSLDEAPSSAIEKIGQPQVDDRGLWIDLAVNYRGTMVLTLQTKLNLMRLKNPQAYEKSGCEPKSAIYNSDVDDSAESSSDEEGSQEIPNVPQDVTAGSANSGGKKFIKMVDRLAESKFFQAATENRYIKKAMEGVSNTHLRLTVEVKAVVGTLVVNIPPPPSDRVWLGFRPVPELSLSAKPVVGERNINYNMVTSWIEKKLGQEFQKIMVIPNMEDFVIPVMNPKLPD